MDLKEIPAGAVVCIHTEYSLVSWSIRMFTKRWANHTALYFGSGKHETVEAEFNGVVIDTLDNRLNKKNKIRIFAKRDLTVSQLSMIKTYAYNRVGHKYDYKALCNFLLRKVGGWFGINISTHDNENRDFCSEMAVNSYKMAELKISDNSDDNTSPGDVLTYLTSRKGIYEKWEQVFSWNC